ncbi:MAG: hypothetical protein JWM56_725 [Candidatus Peribacteria bacterium]|nr:hypothetical protein [Candidatus Peribacteria bacterium]
MGIPSFPMPNLHFTIPHPLSEQEALTRIKSLLEELKKEFGGKMTNLQEKWQGNTDAFSFTVMGFDVSGTLIVRDKEVELQGSLPLAALPFKGKIEETIRKEAQKVLK